MIVTLPSGVTEGQKYPLKYELNRPISSAAWLLAAREAGGESWGINGNSHNPIDFPYSKMQEMMTACAVSIMRSSLILWEPDFLDMAFARYYGNDSVLASPDVSPQPYYHQIVNRQGLVFSRYPFDTNPIIIRSLLVQPGSRNFGAVLCILAEHINGKKVFYPNFCEIGESRFSERIIWSLSRFMREQVKADRVIVPRKIQRGLKNRYVPEVRRITLRAVAPSEPTPFRTPDTSTPTSVEWSCQWTVKGHWRNQYYPSTGEHKPVFVAEYRKGPQDKPLRETQVVVEVKR